MPTLTESDAGTRETTESVESVARRLTQDNIDAEPEILKSYWFPAENEVRLVHVDTLAAPSEYVRPFYFGAAPQANIPYSSAVALILPENDQNGENPLTPPDNWGGWEAAVVVYDAAAKH